MKRLTRFQENISVRKATNYAIIINSLEILLILGVMALVVISPQYDFSPRMMRLLVGVAAAVIIWGAVMDIREAMSTRRLLSQLDAMDDTIDAMEKLNNTLRAQRHDFLNHLQVVYSLMEMEEYGEANSYIEKVYGRITAVSRVLKTASAALAGQTCRVRKGGRAGDAEHYVHMEGTAHFWLGDVQGAVKPD